MHEAITTSDRLSASWEETLDRVRAFVASRVGDRELAADITQDVVVRSIASGALARVDNPTAWLYRSARNAVIDHYRTRRTHDELGEQDHWPEPGETDGPNEATRDLARCLMPLLGELPPAASEALQRVDLDGQTHQQAAGEVGISVSGMKSRVQRARRQLKALLEECCTVSLDRVGAVSTYHSRADGCGCATGAHCSGAGTSSGAAPPTAPAAPPPSPAGTPTPPGSARSRNLSHVHEFRGTEQS